MASRWGVTPRESIRAEVERRGTDAVVDSLLETYRGESVDANFLRVLAGPAADTVVRGREGGVDGYWPRVWALRGLRYVYQPRALDVLVDASTDESWRVREMFAKVVAVHRIIEAVPLVLLLAEDSTPRVRRVAERALLILGEGDSLTDS